MNTTPTPTALSAAEQVMNRIFELQVALQQALPAYESLLHQIHVGLAKDPDVIHLLTEEQIGTICAGLSKKKNVVIATATKSKSTTVSGKKLKDISISDL